MPDFRESYEVPDGMFRASVPAFEESVVRELLVNALVHRPYTQRGDIYLNLDPEKLEVVNPGRLPLGVTPKNILHASRRRNDGLARVFHDLKLMEREGSGFDLMYERLLANGRGAPTLSEGTDSVHVVPPELLKAAGLDQRTTLKRVSPHRLRALVLEDVERYPGSGISAVHRRIGTEISGRAIKRSLDQLIAEGQVQSVGDRRWRTYRPAPAIDRPGQEGR